MLAPLPLPLGAYAPSLRRRYEGPEAELTLKGRCDLLKISAISRERPDSDKNYAFRIVTPTDTLKLDPGSQQAHDQWQEGLMMAIAASSLH